MIRAISVTTLAVLITASTSQAAKVKVWRHHAAAHHEKATCRGTVVDSEGAIRLARQLKPLADLDATHVWDVIEDKQGNLLVATGDEGKVYRVTRNGEVSVALQTEEGQVFCLAQAADGTVYAGTGPHGRVFCIGRDGSSRLHYQSPESYVWCLAVDERERVYAGTGPHGRIYQIAPGGEAKVFYDTRQGHVLSMTFGSDGVLYAGTDSNGLVYRIDGTGKGFVLYQAPQSEVRCLVAGPDGVYAGTSAPRRRDIGSRPVADKSSGVGAPNVLTSGKSASRVQASESPATGTKSSGADGKEEDKKSTAAPAPPPPSPGENSVYRIAADGTGREIFREKAMILSLLPGAGRLFVGTGMEGQLFEIDEKRREHCEIARLDHGQIHRLCRCRDGAIVLGTGDSGRLYVLQERFQAAGTLLSGVLDAKLISQWGALSWEAEAPPGTRLSVAVRSGNLPDPDDTWSEWSPEQSDAQAALAAAPPARYLQYRLSLATADPRQSPSIRSLSVRYRTANQAPEIETLEVPHGDAATADNPKKMRFKWTATDPNEDELTYRIYVRKDGWQGWVLLADHVEKREYEWDTTTSPAGMYQVKIQANDREDNAEEDALSTERIAGPVVVAHAPPTVVVKVAAVSEGRATIEACATDPMVRLTSAAFAVDGKPWKSVFPSDGLFDRTTAKFRFVTDKLEAGTHVLVLRVRDAGGNTGAGDAMINIPGATTAAMASDNADRKIGKALCGFFVSCWP
jgi:hypothetical protein